MKAADIQPGDDVVTHRKGFAWRGVVVMTTRNTVRMVEVDKTAGKVSVWCRSHDGVDTFRVNDDVEVERHT